MNIITYNDLLKQLQQGGIYMFPWDNQQFPFNQNLKDIFNQNGFPKGIDSYIQNVIEKSMQQFAPNLPFNDEQFNKAFNLFQNQNQNEKRSQETPEEKKEPLNYHVFETHDDVFLQIPISNKEQLKNLKIYHTSNKSIIEGIPTRDDKHEIILPAIVKKKGAKATYRDGMLEIKIPKNIDIQFTEIDVQGT